MTSLSATDCTSRYRDYAVLSDAFCGAAILNLLIGPPFVPAIASLSEGSVRSIVDGQFWLPFWNGLCSSDLSVAACLMAIGFKLALTCQRPMSRCSQSWLITRAAGIALILFGFGAIDASSREHWSPNSFPISGFFQRIAICYLVCSLIYYSLSAIVRNGILVATLVTYWFVLKTVVALGSRPNEPTLQNNLAVWLDERLLSSRLYSTLWDSDGLLTLIPAFASCLIGTFWGDLLRSEYSTSSKLLWLIVGGMVSLNLELLSQPEAPINQSLWTSTHFLAAAGICSMVLAGIYCVIDVFRRECWLMPISVVGHNLFFAILFLRLTPIGTIVGANVGTRVCFCWPQFGPFLQAAFEVVANWLILLWISRILEFFIAKRQAV